MSYMEGEMDRQIEAGEHHMEFIMDLYPEIGNPYNIPEGLWIDSECPICKSKFNIEKLKTGILFCDKCNQTVDEISKELEKEHQEQLKEDILHAQKDQLEGLF